MFPGHGQCQTPSTGLRHSKEGAGKRCLECGPVCEGVRATTVGVHAVSHSKNTQKEEILGDKVCLS